MYDKGMYIDPECSDTSIDPLNHCNYLGIGQDCRGCYMTCEGAMRYKEDFAAEYAIVVSALLLALKISLPLH